MVKKIPTRNGAENPDFTYNDLNRAGIRFNNKNVIEIEYYSDSEDLTITKTDELTETVKTIVTNFDNPGGGSAVLGTKTITENGTYTAADDELDGYSSVTVNVPVPVNRETEILDGSLSGTYTNNTVTTIREMGLSNMAALTTLEMPALISPGKSAFRNNTGLTSINMPEVTNIGQYCFTGCTSLNNVSLPKLTSLTANAFENCTGLTAFDFPQATGIGNSALRNIRCPVIVLPKVTNLDTNCMSGNTALTAVDMGSLATTGGGSAFAGNTAFNTLIIRKEGFVALNNSNHFTGTPFAIDGTGGDLYVLSDYITQYEQGTNWSALNVTVHAIENSYYETHYADGTEITP